MVDNIVLSEKSQFVVQNQEQITKPPAVTVLAVADTDTVTSDDNASAGSPVVLSEVDEANFVTFIEAANGVRLTKTYTATKDGEGFTASSYPNVYALNSYRCPMPDTVEAFAALIEQQGGQGRALMTSNFKKALRNESRKGQAVSGQKIRWLCLDLDGVPYDEVEAFIQDVPYLRGVSCVVQYSPSHGLKEGLRAHLFYLLDEAYGHSELTTFVSAFSLEVPKLRDAMTLTETRRSLSKKLDTAGVRPAGIVYIAPPELVGMVDPVPQRVRVIQGVSETLSLKQFPAAWHDSAAVSRGLREILNQKREAAGLEPVAMHHSGFNCELLKRIGNDADFKIAPVDRDPTTGYVRCNINGGDSGAYYFKSGAPLVVLGENYHNAQMHSYKDEPPFVIAEFAPEFANTWNAHYFPEVDLNALPDWLRQASKELIKAAEKNALYDAQAARLAQIERFGSSKWGATGVDLTESLNVLTQRHAGIIARIKGDNDAAGEDVRALSGDALLKSITHEAISDGMHYTRLYGLLKFWHESIFFGDAGGHWLENISRFEVLAHECAKKLIRADRLPVGIFDHLKASFGTSTKNGVSTQVFKGVTISLSIENLAKCLSFYGMNFRYNLLTRRAECAMNGGSWEDANDEQMSVIYSVLNRVGFPTDATLKTLLPALPLQAYHNPVLDKVLAGHSRWLAAGKPDILRQLFETIEVDEKDEQYRNMIIKRWFIQGVAKSCSGEDRKDSVTGVGVLTLHGRQGAGKSRWFASLVPAEDKGLVKLSVKVDPNHKDSVLTATRYFISELGELDGITSRTAAADMKAFLSAETDAVRLPYGRMDKEYKRRTNFGATVNADRFLVDETGNRRFWVLSPTHVNHNHGLDVWMVWGQAFDMWQNGERHWLSDDENMLVDEKTRRYLVASEGLEGALHSMFNFEAPKSEWTNKMKGDEIALALGFDRAWITSETNMRPLRRTLTGLGVETVKSNGINKYKMPPMFDRQSASLPLSS